MMYDVQMGSDVIIFMPRFIKTGSRVEKLIGRDSQTESMEMS
jgi:hypothetical protein